MSWTNSHSLIATLSAFAADGTLSSRLTLSAREHDSARMPVLAHSMRKAKLASGFSGQQFSKICRAANAKAATAVLQDLRAHLRVAEDLIAKLGYQMRELQNLRISRPSNDEFTMIAVNESDSFRQSSILEKYPQKLAKVLHFRKQETRSDKSSKVTE